MCAQLVSDNCLLFPKDSLYLSLSVFGNHGNKCHSNSGKSKPGRWAAERKWERMKVCACVRFCDINRLSKHGFVLSSVGFINEMWKIIKSLSTPHQNSRDLTNLFSLIQGTESQDYFSKALKVAVRRPLVHHTSQELFNLIPLVGLKHLQHGRRLLSGEGIVLILLFIYWWDSF